MNQLIILDATHPQWRTGFRRIDDQGREDPHRHDAGEADMNVLGAAPPPVERTQPRLP